MKNSEIMGILNLIRTIGSNYKGAKFNYFLAKNDRLIRGELSIIDEIMKPSPEFLKFEQERYKLCAEYSNKDEHGTPIIRNNSYDINIERKDEFEKKLEELKNKPENIPVVKQRDEQFAKYKEVMDVENDIQLHKIKLSDIPDDLSKDYIDGLFDLIIQD